MHLNVIPVLIRRLNYFYVLLLVIFNTLLFSQNETNKWYFGLTAGLDFMTNPPTILTNGVLSTQEGCASVADAAGNVLFYTDGSTIKNSLNLLMTNGFGLTGGISSTQSAIIIKKPGSSTIYYVFTTGGTLAGSINYSTVDMTLSSGLGAVTVLNTQLGTGSTEKLTAVRHCNGTDVWILSHDKNTNNFKCFLVTSAGVSTTPVNTSIGTSHVGWSNWVGYLRPSPNGKKLAVCVDSTGFELYDFDASTGVISNSLTLAHVTRAYGVEFSPDGTKLYGTRGFMNSPLYQWDLCAGSPAAVIASQYTMACDPTTYRYTLQQASNGKIYVARYNQNTIGVIHNPNLAGAACNFIELGQSVSPGFSSLGLPNFMPSLFKPQPLPFVYTTNNALYGCQTASFTLPAVSTMSLVNCVSAGYSVTNVSWNFGDPSSGSANTSTLPNPTHAYSVLGTYTTQVILYYSCGGGSDTLNQQVIVNQPCFNVIANGITCSSPGSATVNALGGTGPYSYTWMPTSQTTSVATGLYPGTYSITVTDHSNNSSYTATTSIGPTTPYTGTVSSTPSVACNGALTGTASVSISGGSGSQSYVWNSSAGSQTTMAAGNLGADIYTLTVTDGLGHCSFIKTFTITQPPALTLVIAASSPSVCLGAGITFTASGSGGTPGYSYTWTAGPQTNTYNSNQSLAGNYTYTVTGKDLNNCIATQTTSVSFIANPAPGITPNYTALCAGAGLLMHGSGGTSYAWSGPNNFSSGLQNITLNNITLPAQGIYSLVVSAASCTAGLTQSITVFPLPAPTVSALPACELHPLQFTVNPGGGILYAWTGPLNFTSTVQNPAINSASVAHNGNYIVTVTDVNGCKASDSISIHVLPNPIVTANSATVCFGYPATLTASGAANYSWSGPSGFTSNAANALVPVAGNVLPQSYTVTGTSINGCADTTVAYLNTIELPTPVIYVTPRACVNSTVNLQGSGGAFYEWRGPYNFSASSQTVVFTAVNSAFAGIYTLTVRNAAGCYASKTVLLLLDEQPNGSLQNNQTRDCIPFCSDLSLKLNSASPLVSTSWQINNQTFNTPAFNYCFTSAGDYIIKGSFTNSLGCSNTNTFVVTANPLPKADFEFYPAKPVENFDRVEFINTSTGVNLNAWNWFFADNLKHKAYTENTSYLFDNAGTYPIAFLVQDGFGCTDTIVKTITVMNDFEVFVPDAFTPNQDGLNDVFQPKGRGIVKLNLLVYDRWGEKIFQTTDLNKGWDGTFKGEDCKTDIYAWKVEASGGNGKSKNLSGLVTLYR